MVELENVTVSFRAKERGISLFSRSEKHLKAVDKVSFSIMEGETFGLVGETGSGKSTIARTLVGLYRPSSGIVRLLGREINYRKKSDIFYLRENVGIVFQDPVGSLNPRLSVREIVSESLIASGKVRKEDFEKNIINILERVGLRKSALDMHPRELSGGERQRVSLARALVVPKKLLILDEPTSSLDMTIQAQVLNTLRKLKKELNLSILFITHDINVIRYMSSKLGVLFYGKLLEIGNTYDVLSQPLHPYAQELLSNIPKIEKEGRELHTNEATRTLVEHHPANTGCIYRLVCPKVFERCMEVPALAETSSNHLVSCFLNHGHVADEVTETSRVL